MRIQYRHPKLYQFLVQVFYPKALWEKLRAEVGENNTVFDVGAGFGYVARFLHPSNQYYGIDRNEIFVEYGRKNGRNLELKDIFDKSAYRESDIFLVIDVVHHFSIEKLKILFDLIFAHTKKKVIVVEPTFLSKYNHYGIGGNFVGWIFRILDGDGFNKIGSWLREEEYQKLFQSRFSSEYDGNFEMNHQKVGGHHFVVFARNEKAAGHRW